MARSLPPSSDTYLCVVCCASWVVVPTFTSLDDSMENMHKMYKNVASKLKLSMSPEESNAWDMVYELRGTVEGNPIRVRRLLRNVTKRKDYSYLLIRSEWLDSLGAGLHVCTAGFGHKLAMTFGLVGLTFGDREFDYAFASRARDREFAREILHEDVRSSLLNLQVEQPDFPLGDVQLDDKSIRLRFCPQQESAQLIIRKCLEVSRIATMVQEE
jgi:hypothetical protein